MRNTHQDQHAKVVGALIKPASSLCNLACSYCFYVAKKHMYPWQDNPKMSLETLRVFLHQHMALSASPYFYVWQGGEPTLMGLDFYKAAVQLQGQVASEVRSDRRVQIGNAIQTNGLLLNDSWAKFFKQWRFFVGISLDGPPGLHDTYRRDFQGAGTHSRVMRSVDTLRRHDVDFNVLATVTKANVGHAPELLEWFVSHGFLNLQFSPCAELERLNDYGGPMTRESISPAEYGQFLNELFGAWVQLGIGRIRIRWFDNLIQMLWGRPSQICQVGDRCGYVLLEHNGDCYPCDFLVEEAWKLGNVHCTNLATMLGGDRFSSLQRAKTHLHPSCLDCPWVDLCCGECPRYRLVNTGSVVSAKPYFCASYLDFFDQSYGKLEDVAARIGLKYGCGVRSRRREARTSVGHGIGDASTFEPRIE